MPKTCYTTPAEQNHLNGNVYSVSGIVDEVVPKEKSKTVKTTMFSVKNDFGTVWFAVFDADYFAESTGGDKDSFEALMDSSMDYTIPKEGDNVTVYGIYSGFSEVYKAPILYFGLDEFVYESLNEVIKSSKNTETPTPTPETTTAPKQEKSGGVEKPTATASQSNALSSAKRYLDFTAFSYAGLISQLEYEQFSTEDATYAADNCGADWNEQAVKSAKAYLKYSAFSYSGLIHQLEYEEFTTDQATYGADNCGADWNEQAVKSAESYLKYSSFSHGSLVDQLIYEGFTPEQAEYGVSQNGL